MVNDGDYGDDDDADADDDDDDDDEGDDDDDDDDYDYDDVATDDDDDDAGDDGDDTADANLPGHRPSGVLDNQPWVVGCWMWAWPLEKVFWPPKKSLKN